MTNPRPVTISTTLDLNKVRPVNPEHCSDEQFEIFCNGVAHVLAGNADTIPLHAAIRESLHRFSHKGISCLDAVEGDFTNIARTTYLLTGPQLARGRLNSGWTAFFFKEEEVNGEMVDTCTAFDPIWLEVFVNICLGETPHNLDELILSPEVLMNIDQRRDQLKYIVEWAENIIHMGEEKAQALNQPAPQCEVTLSYVPQPNVKLVCRMPEFENAELVFCITCNDINGEFNIDLEWESGCNHPLVDFAIPHLIADSYIHDEKVAIMRGELTAPTYRLHIDPRGIAA